MNQNIVDFESYIDKISENPLAKSDYCKILGLHRVSYAQIKSGIRPLAPYIYLHMVSIRSIHKNKLRKLISERVLNG